MAKIRDYVHQVAELPFEDFPLTLLDMACLNELAYLPFGDYLPATLERQQFHAFRDLVAMVGQDKLDQLSYNFLVTKDRVDLFEALVSSPRFADLELGYYVNDVSSEYERQFAAMVMRLPSIDHTQVIFRGTDDTLVGWKEDFNMSYMRTIPAQYAATTYLRQFLTGHEGQLMVSGHSKGGNLALYAVSHLQPYLQEKVTQVLVFDAPGLHQSVLASQGYQAICDRIQAFRPKDSVVGIILGIAVPYQTVDSLEKGLLQHNMLHWQVTEDGFVMLDGLSDLSLTLEQTFADWLAQYSNQDLKRYFDSFFDIFFTSGISSLNDLDHEDSPGLTTVLSSFNNLPRHQREFMVKATSQLLTIYQKHAFEAAWASRPQLFGDLLGKWLSRTDDSALNE